MKTSALLAIAAAATARATGPSDKEKFNCAKPNANYCLGPDIILRCDANSIGTPGRCSANVSGYPPLGGMADCYESSREAGDAACVKNCVVYAEPSFTLAADKCTPSYTPTASSPVDKPTKSYAGSASSDTSIMSIPEGTSVSTPKPSPPPYTTRSHHHHPTNMTQPIIHTKTKTKSEYESEPGSCATPTGPPSAPPCGAGSSTVGGTGAPHTPTVPYATGSQTTVPTAAAAANHAAGLLAAAGVVAAYLL